MEGRKAINRRATKATPVPAFLVDLIIALQVSCLLIHILLFLSLLFFFFSSSSSSPSSFFFSIFFFLLSCCGTVAGHAERVLAERVARAGARRAVGAQVYLLTPGTFSFLLILPLAIIIIFYIFVYFFALVVRPQAARNLRQGRQGNDGQRLDHHGHAGRGGARREQLEPLCGKDQRQGVGGKVEYERLHSFVRPCNHTVPARKIAAAGGGGVHQTAARALAQPPAGTWPAPPRALAQPLTRANHATQTLVGCGQGVLRAPRLGRGTPGPDKRTSTTATIFFFFFFFFASVHAYGVYIRTQERTRARRGLHKHIREVLIDLKEH